MDSGVLVVVVGALTSAEGGHSCSCLRGRSLLSTMKNCLKVREGTIGWTAASCLAYRLVFLPPTNLGNPTGGRGWGWGDHISLRGVGEGGTPPSPANRTATVPPPPNPARNPVQYYQGPVVMRLG